MARAQFRVRQRCRGLSQQRDGDPRKPSCLSLSLALRAYDAVRIADRPEARDRLERFLSVWEEQGCRMVEMSAGQHDAHAASSQFVTHLTGRLLGNLELAATPIDTKGFQVRSASSRTPSPTAGISSTASTSSTRPTPSTSSPQSATASPSSCGSSRTRTRRPEARDSLSRTGGKPAGNFTQSTHMCWRDREERGGFTERREVAFSALFWRVMFHSYE